MAHPRKLIRAQVQTQLAASADLTALVGTRVYRDRYTALRTGQMPAVVVTTGSEECELGVNAPREQNRSLELKIECLAGTTGDGTPDLLDDLAEAVEAAMVDDTLNDLASDCLLKGTGTSFEDEGQTVIGALVLTYEVTYTTHDQPSTDAFDDFDKASIKYNLGGGQADADQAEDSLTNLHE